MIAAFHFQFEEPETYQSPPTRWLLSYFEKGCSYFSCPQKKKKKKVAFSIKGRISFSSQIPKIQEARICVCLLGGGQGPGRLERQGSELLLQLQFGLCSLGFTNIPKAPGIMESIPQPENQELILAPFPTSLEILGSWLRVSVSLLCFSPGVRMVQA